MVPTSATSPHRSAPSTTWQMENQLWAKIKCAFLLRPAPLSRRAHSLTPEQIYRAIRGHDTCLAKPFSCVATCRRILQFAHVFQGQLQGTVKKCRLRMFGVGSGARQSSVWVCVLWSLRALLTRRFRFVFSLKSKMNARMYGPDSSGFSCLSRATYPSHLFEVSKQQSSCSH